MNFNVLHDSLRTEWKSHMKIETTKIIVSYEQLNVIALCSNLNLVLACGNNICCTEYIVMSLIPGLPSTNRTNRNNDALLNEYTDQWQGSGGAVIGN